MKIEGFSISRFRNAEFVSLGSDVVAITKSYDWVGLGIPGFYTRVETSLNNLVVQLNKLNTTTETAGAGLADKQFNNAWRALKYICLCYELHPNEDKRKAAAVLINLSKTHGYNLHQESLQEQNAKAKMFLADCENVEEAKLAIQQLGIKDIVDNVQIALDALVLILDERNSKNADQKRENDTKLFRKELTESLDGMFKYMESMSGLVSGGELDTMIKKVNESILKLEMSQNMRGRRKSEELAETE
ncbi:hypothetical protein GQR60_02715 [Labilibaculum sp. A4]|uniref:DUF6261 family protein n=1 Tax=Labilibaculum euxinus TaxID=2686357 RepID=UPI000F619F34|nr:DUF6261 family protein [Labilibaculum euxinus]MDQ1770539.1 DUF6261 family protein [Labilibaculum euxinus]MWN75242.1 hypothetical protein [Labilibaculum euxinus]